ncbi:hypothetical protein BC940DRAFT_102864 [Gongronella butleri]|nr:hypothetical protein BC940DRAFT_102864 [Gongronella butleri]
MAWAIQGRLFSFNCSCSHFIFWPLFFFFSLPWRAWSSIGNNSRFSRLFFFFFLIFLFSTCLNFMDRVALVFLKRGYDDDEDPQLQQVQVTALPETDRMGVIVGCMFAVLVVLTAAIVTMILWHKRRRYPPACAAPEGVSKRMSMTAPFTDQGYTKMSPQQQPTTTHDDDATLTSSIGPDARGASSGTHPTALSSIVIVEDDEDAIRTLAQSAASSSSILPLPHPAVTIFSTPLYFEPLEHTTSADRDRPIIPNRNRNSRFQEFF